MYIHKFKDSYRDKYDPRGSSHPNHLSYDTGIIHNVWNYYGEHIIFKSYIPLSMNIHRTSGGNKLFTIKLHIPSLEILVLYIF